MTAKEVAALVRPNIKALTPYSTARDEFQGSIGVFLDANESPFPREWNRYPDPRQKALKERISAIKGVKPECIFLGNGSDEAIDLILRVFCIPAKDNIVAIAPSYGMYAVSADINDIEVRSVRLREDFSLDSAKLLESCDTNTKAVFLCSPNNPSGNALEQDQITEILEKFQGIVVVDEAYIDFSSKPSMLPLLDKYPNLIVLQTMSKARGMAALRLGMAFSQSETIRTMSMVKYPYNINESTQKLVLEALQEPIDQEVSTIISERTMLQRELPGLSSVLKVYPSDANFLLVKVTDADAIYNYLISKGLIVRNRNRVPGCEGCLRITVGLPSENELLLKSLKEYEESNIRR